MSVPNKQPQLSTALVLQAGLRHPRHLSKHEAATSQEADNKEQGHRGFLRTRDTAHRRVGKGLKRKSRDIGKKMVRVRELQVASFSLQHKETVLIDRFCTYLRRTRFSMWLVTTRGQSCDAEVSLRSGMGHLRSCER
jgi:hypothetical protein